MDLINKAEARSRIEMVIGEKLPFFGVGTIEAGPFTVVMADYRKVHGYAPVVAVAICHKDKAEPVDRFNVNW